MKKQKWKQASFTVEAALLVPIVATIIVLLMGYIYYTHEIVWAKSVAYEAEYYSVQRREKDVSAQDMMQKAVDARVTGKPLAFGKAEFEVSETDTEASVSWQGGILAKVFGDRFDFKDETAVRKITPGEARRKIWLAKYAVESLTEKEE